MPPALKAQIEQKQRAINTLCHHQEQEQGHEITPSQHLEIVQHVDEAIIAGKLKGILGVQSEAKT
ncbi:hypothetical protein ACFLVH_03515 [Chloroflexota bacterium]